MEMCDNMWTIMRQHNLSIIDHISSDCRCTICEDILVDACSAPCGCRFCRDCIKHYLKEERNMCPGQSDDCKIHSINLENDIHRDGQIGMKISRLRVKCPNIDCGSEMELEMLANHLTTCDKRPQSSRYSELSCGDEFREHLLTEPVSHKSSMMNWMIECLNETRSLKMEVKKLKANNHEMKEQMRIDKENSQKSILGLQNQARENISEIQLLNDEMCALKNSNRSLKKKLKKGKDKQRKQISQLNEQVRNQRKEIDHLKEQHQLVVLGCDAIHDETDSSIDRQFYEEMLVKSDGSSLVNYPMRTKCAESTNPSQDIFIETICGQFEWKIDNWSDKVKRAQNGNDMEIFSDSFFTHQNGFKICLSVRPYYFGGYLVISFYITRGPFDDMLRWPFSRDVELSLIDHETGLAFDTKMIKYSNCPAYLKPKRKRNEFGGGFSFISLKELSSRPELCMDDQIWIKCSVKPVAV